MVVQLYPIIQLHLKNTLNQRTKNVACTSEVVFETSSLDVVASKARDYNYYTICQAVVRNNNYDFFIT